MNFARLLQRKPKPAETLSINGRDFTFSRTKSGQGYIRIGSTFAQIGRNIERAIKTSAWVVFLVALSSCTIVPKPVDSRRASIGMSGRADSGTIGIAKLPKTQISGYEVDEKTVARYNALIEAYGADPLFKPVIELNEGVRRDGKGGVYMERESYIKFAVMNEWRRMGKPAIKKSLLDRLIP